MTFSADWLKLREPADHAALHPGVLAALSAQFASANEIRVIDLGCGAGSNLRGISSHLPSRQQWTLVDYDPKLLSAARERLIPWSDSAAAAGSMVHLRRGKTALAVGFKEADLSRCALQALFGDADLVTAAALFDLVSVARIDDVAEAVVGAGKAFYTSLTYDGFAQWTPAHPHDAEIRERFNRHQQGDKGFGPAAGPEGVNALAAAFYRRGYRVLRGTSPWRVDARYGALRSELDQGFANAAREAGAARAVVEAWLSDRNAASDPMTIVGHEDLLAVPA